MPRDDKGDSVWRMLGMSFVDRLPSRRSARISGSIALALLSGPLLPVQPASANKPRRVAVAYLGDSVVRPGARISYEGTFFERGAHSLVAAAHVGGHGGPASDGYSVLIYFDGGYRYSTRFGLFFDLRAGLGYANATQPMGPRVQADGSSVITPETTANYLAPIGTAGLGFDLLAKTQVPLSLFVLGGAIGRYNAAEPFSGSPLLIAGLAYQFGTGGPSRAELPVPSVPPAEAPPLTDSPAAAGTYAPADGAPPTGPAEPAPPGSMPGPGFGPAPGPVVPAIPDAPPLPPPPTVPYVPSPADSPAAPLTPRWAPDPAPRSP